MMSPLYCWYSEDYVKLKKWRFLLSVGQLVANSSKFWQFEKSKCKLMSENDDILSNLRLVKKRNKNICSYNKILYLCKQKQKNR